MVDEDSEIATDSRLIEYGFLVIVLLLPALGMYNEMLHEDVFDAKIENLGWSWVMGHLIMSITASAVGLYILFKQIILTLILKWHVKKQYKNKP